MDKIDDLKTQQENIEQLLIKINEFKSLFREKQKQIENQWNKIHDLYIKYNLDTSSFRIKSTYHYHHSYFLIVPLFYVASMDQYFLF